MALNLASDGGAESKAMRMEKSFWSTVVLVTSCYLT